MGEDTHQREVLDVSHDGDGVGKQEGSGSKSVDIFPLLVFSCPGRTLSFTHLPFCRRHYPLGGLDRGGGTSEGSRRRSLGSNGPVNGLGLLSVGPNSQLKSHNPKTEGGTVTFTVFQW